MKKNGLSVVLLLMSTILFAQQPDNKIHLNSLGFLPKQKKEATVTTKSATFVVKDALTNKNVFSGKTTGPYYQKDVNQQVWMADFSKLKTKGNYYLELPSGERSATFPINNEVYSDPFRVSMLGFYLWRCGTSVHAEYNDNVFSHAACHLEDGYEDYIGNKGHQRNGVGGWHDAGDYGKYIVNTGITLGILFMTWEHFQSQIQPISFIPDSENDISDFLKELKWEMDWVLKMQYPDGSGRVSHKLTRTHFSPFIMPEFDKEKRYFTEWSSAATASFAAMTAKASQIFALYDPAFSKKCLDAARLSYGYLKQHPEEKPFVQGDFQTGGYQTKDADDKLWAAAEMWNATGEKEFLIDFEQQASDMNFVVEENWDWGNVSNLGIFSYLLSKRKGKDKIIEQKLRQNTLKVADEVVSRSAKDVYRRPFERYYWGCNGTVARLTVNLFVADKLNPNKKYKNAAYDTIGHLFGRNYYNRSYVTGLGLNPPMNPHDRRCGADNLVHPWPGYLVGGGHSAIDWVDKEESYSHNEIAINWQAPLVFALAWVLR